MAKKIVEVDEDLLKGMMTSDIPLYGRDTERKETEPAPKKAATAEPENISDAPAEREISEQPKSVRNRRKKESGSDYRELFLVNTPSPNRSQTYINRDIYERIKRFLPLIAPEVSIASYISNILGDHIERHWEEINEIFLNRCNHGNLFLFQCQDGMLRVSLLSPVDFSVQAADIRLVGGYGKIPSQKEREIG